MFADQKRRALNADQQILVLTNFFLEVVPLSSKPRMNAIVDYLGMWEVGLIHDLNSDDNNVDGVENEMWQVG